VVDFVINFEIRGLLTFIKLNLKTLTRYVKPAPSLQQRVPQRRNVTGCAKAVSPRQRHRSADTNDRRDYPNRHDAA